jgi:predicted small secreted protein
MNRTSPQTALLLLAAILVAACDRGGDTTPGAGRATGAVTLTISGDSVIEMAQAATGTVECPVTFTGTAEGPEGEHAVMRGGRIAYYWWVPGTEAGVHELTRDEVVRLWYDSIFHAGHSRVSHAQGFGQGSPPQPVRGEAWFEYATSNTDEVKRTEPFRFYCY